MNLLKPMLTVCIFCSCHYTGSNPKLATQQNAGSNLQIHLYTTGDSGFGYSIAVKGKTIIYQPTIPAIQAAIPFASREDAWRTALLVKQKIEHFISPPAISINELDSMHIRY